MVEHADNRRRRKRFVFVGLFIAGALIAAVGARELRHRANRLRPAPEPKVSVPDLQVGASPEMPPQVIRHEVAEITVTQLVRDLQVIWGLAVADDGRLFITERPGRILVFDLVGKRLARYARMSVAQTGESGLMGIALHPQFPEVPWVYVMYTARKAGGAVNRVSRLTDRDGRGVEETVLIDDIPAARNHDGGALAFGPDGALYVGTGDAGRPALAQDLSGPNGKILRIHPDGRVPSDNPFTGSPIWAYGFRNVSGLAFHPATRDLWAASHGPSGKEPDEHKHMDSVYKAVRGANHGWPSFLGVHASAPVVPPLVFFRDRPVPPGGVTFRQAEGVGASLLMTSLRGQELLRFTLHPDGRPATIERWWPNRFGRLRAIASDGQGRSFVGTSNRDGKARGSYPDSDAIYELTDNKVPGAEGASR